MATPIIMPRQGQSVESCIISKWYKEKGDHVKAGDLLFSYETDKANFEEESKDSGILLDVYFEEGDDVPCLTTICVIGEAGENTQEYNPHGKMEAKLATQASNQVEENLKKESKIEVLSMVHVEEGKKISPRAKKTAEKAGIDYRYAIPSGPYGRIIEKDIIALQETGQLMTLSARDEYTKAEAHPLIQGTGLGGRITTSDLNAEKINLQNEQSAEALYEEMKLTNMRKVIAKTMFNSITSTCQLTLNTSFDASAILAFRKKLKEGKDKLALENITLNDMILFAVSRILLNHKDLNAHFYGDRMLYFKNVNLGVAVDTDRGLMVPNLFNANLKSLNQLSKEVKKLNKECQSGSINPDWMKNGSFTVTNLGTMGIESFTPILNPPQTGILGVSNFVQRAREHEGNYEFYPAMGLSLTFDHRALDGAPAARFLQDLVNHLESFSLMLVK